MPRSPLHILRWSSERHQYELVTQHHLEQHFHTEHQWLLWLETATSFSFQGASGRLNVYKEARARGGTYWYAYAPASKRTRKRYLGQTANLTFERLEETARALNSSSPETTSPPQPVEQPVILRTKLSPPHLPVMAIRRARLHTRLDAAKSHRLTLVSASAGWGKTTLLSAWAAQAPERVAWLSLDELDNNPVRFWLSVLAALRTRLPAIGKHTQMMLNAQQPPALTTIIMTLLHDLETLAEPLFLLLDDYHHITEQSIHDTMLFLLEHLPPHLHLILVSRIDPPFALSRLRLHGQLLELRDADVRFLEDEAASFLSQTMGLTLEANDVHLLVRRTAGWVAGLQLAAFSMQHYEDRSEFIRAFTGGHRSLLDYVQEEILTGLPPALHDFLLQTSLLKSITAPLCQAVTHETRSQELLEAIERANLFVVPLDRERRWYRIHDLFREALQRRLKATQPELVPLLHQRAARWYEEQGARQEAIAHALDGADYDYAIALMQQRVEVAWLRGEAQNLYHWIMALPETYIRAHADFVLTATLYLLNTAASVSHPQHRSTLDRVKQMITRVEANLRQPDLPEPENLQRLQQRLSLLHLGIEHIEIMASTSDDIETLIRRLTQVQQQMQALHLDDEIVWHTIPLSVAFILHWSLLQKSGFLIPQYQEAWQRARQSGNPFALLKISQWLALLYLGVGQLSLAYQQSIEALALIEQFDGYALLKGYFLFCLVNVLYHRNQVEEARPLLQSMLHDAQIFQQVDLQIAARIYQIKVELAAGEHARAHDMLQQVQALVQSQGFSLHAERIIPVCVEYWLATGDLAQAAQWATSYTSETWKDNDTATVLLVARIFLVLQRYPAALELLERFREQYFEQMENTENKAEFLALLVVALHQTGKREQVHTTLLRLLALCEPEKRLRVLLNMGQPMRHILTRFLNSDEDATLRSFASSVLAAFAREEQRRVGGTSANKASRNASAPASSNPLTAQEQRVLRLLAAGQTYAEIAERLVVSRNTIKTQVSSIYRKLGVSRRVEALTLAQQLSLLQENITP